MVIQVNIGNGNYNVSECNLRFSRNGYRLELISRCITQTLLDRLIDSGGFGDNVAYRFIGLRSAVLSFEWAVAIYHADAVHATPRLMCTGRLFYDTEVTDRVQRSSTTCNDNRELICRREIARCAALLSILSILSLHHSACSGK